MAVIKRNTESTKKDLTKALGTLIELLDGQDEPEAIEILEQAKATLAKSGSNSEGQKAAVSSIIEAFEGELELIAYTLQRDRDQWTDVEELSQASSRVLSLARRLRTR